MLVQGSNENDEKLRLSVAWQKKTTSPAEPVGNIVSGYLASRDSGFRKSISVVDIWKRALPPHFYEHCRIGSLKNGVLTLDVRPGPFMHELKLMSDELLVYLQDQCGRSAVKKIILRPGVMNDFETDEE